MDLTTAVLRRGIELLNGREQDKKSAAIAGIPKALAELGRTLSGGSDLFDLAQLPRTRLRSPLARARFLRQTNDDAWYEEAVMDGKTLPFPQPASELAAVDIQPAKVPDDEADKDTLLTRLESHGSLVPVSDRPGYDDLSVYQFFRLLAAVAQCGDSQMHLVAADLSGIQPFIHTGASWGALKTARARSFLLELLLRHFGREVTTAAGLCRAAILQVGGGRLLMLLPETAKVMPHELAVSVNDWLLKQAGGTIYLALADKEVTTAALVGKDFAGVWHKLGVRLDEAKAVKFRNKLNELLAVGTYKYSGDDECQACHRDDDFEPVEHTDQDTGLVRRLCPFCDTMFMLGRDLTEYKYVFGWKSEPADTAISLPGISGDKWYWVGGDHSKADYRWAVNRYEEKNGVWPWLRADWVFKPSPAEKGEKPDIADFPYLAEEAKGANRIGCLRMDVDNLGLVDDKLVSQGLPAFLAFSTAVEWFFATGVNECCRKQKRLVHVIFSGGDDLLIAGAWSDTTELLEELGTSFHRYATGSDLSVSAGLFLEHPAYPFYQLARQSAEALARAKNYQRSCLPDRYGCGSADGCGWREGNDCRRKGNVVMFYEPGRDEKIRSGPPPLVVTRLVLSWTQFFEQVCEPARGVRELLAVPGEPVFSRSVLRGLFNVADDWERDWPGWLNRVQWNLSRLRVVCKTAETRARLDSLGTYLRNPEALGSLRSVLTWLDLEQR